MAMRDDVQQLVDSTPFVDTHEHTWEESLRIAAKTEDKGIPAADIGMLFAHYSDSDLMVAGLPQADMAKVHKPGLAPRDKWRILEPYYEACRNTGYLQCVRETVRALYQEDDLHEGNVDAVSQRIADLVQPGYYEGVLREAALVEHAQVNALGDPNPVFRETEQPGLLCQDLSFVALSTGLNIDGVARVAGRSVASLADWHGVIDWCFATYGPRAIAIKNQSAYARRLDYDDVPTEDAAPLFDQYLRDATSLSPAELKAVQDHLFHYCIRKAIEYDLPIKLHTGYYAGHNHMPLHRLRNNAGDLCPILVKYPDAKFIIMHIVYPYQDEAIALAKHYNNAYIDMCWAWIINPQASVRFVKEFLGAAPSNKLLTFGGDFLPIELTVGHAIIARRGLAQALSELIEERWIDAAHAPALVDRTMRGNAHALFDYAGTLANWSKGAA